MLFISLCDVSKETNIKNLIEVAQKKFGHIDLFCSNAEQHQI